MENFSQHKMELFIKVSTTRMRKPPDLLHIRAENRAGKQVMSPSYFPQDGNYGNLATISAEDRALRVGDVFVIFPQHGSHGMGYQSWGKGKVKAKMEEASIPKCDVYRWG